LSLVNQVGSMVTVRLLYVSVSLVAPAPHVASMVWTHY
jgi:hypothetical protein